MRSGKSSPTATPLQSADGDHWWLERRLVARKLLDQGDVYAAYAIVRDNAAESLEKRIEAEFHAGWIALRYLNHPATAARTSRMPQGSRQSRSRSRKPFIGRGRAAEALGAHEEGRGFLERAADHSTTYYGQLARAKLGLPEVQLRSVGNDGRAAFGASPVGKAVKRLYEAGYRTSHSRFARISQRA